MRSHCELHRHRPWSGVTAVQPHQHHQAVDVLLLLLPHQDAFGGAENPSKWSPPCTPPRLHLVLYTAPSKLFSLTRRKMHGAATWYSGAMQCRPTRDASAGSMTSSEGSQQRAQRLSCQTRAKRADSGRFHIPPKHWLASTRRHWSRHYLVARRLNSRTG